MDYKQTAADVLEKVGGKENIVNAGHCATRLRLTLKNDEDINTDDVKKIKGVVGCVNKGGQFQVIIGNDVTFVYDEFMKLIGGQRASSETGETEEKKGIFTRIINYISGSVFPVIPALVGGGLVKAVLALLAAFSLVDRSGTTYQMLNLIGDAPFYFLPVLIGFSAANKLKANPFIGASIGAMLISPSFVSLVSAAKEAGTAITLFGIPVAQNSYSSSIIPILLAVWLLSYLEPWLQKHMPKEIRMIFVPLVEFLIVAPVTFWLLAPIGSWIGELLAAGIGALNNVASWLVPTIVGALCPLLVMTGMHYALIPLGVQQLASTGIDTIAGPGMLVSNIAQGGANLAASIRFKDPEKKSLAASCGIEAVCGITEPAMYGISLPYRRPLYAAMIGGGIGGFFLGIMHVGRYAQVAPSIFALPSYIPEDGSLTVMIYAAIGCAISFAAAFVMELILGVNEEVPEGAESKTEMPAASEDGGDITAMADGEMIDITTVSDPVFSQQMMGTSAAFRYYGDKVTLCAPSDGTLTVLYPTGHAFGITRNDGVELLVHIGIDTVEANGEGFTLGKYKQGDQVKAGDPIVTVDLKKLSEKYDMSTMLIVTNANGTNIVFKKPQTVKQGQVITE